MHIFLQFIVTGMLLPFIAYVHNRRQVNRLRIVKAIEALELEG